MTAQEIETQYKRDMETTHVLRQFLLHAAKGHLGSVEFDQIVERNEIHAELKRTIARLQAEVEKPPCSKE